MAVYMKNSEYHDEFFIIRCEADLILPDIILDIPLSISDIY